MFTFLPLLQWNLETIGDVMLALVCVCVCVCVCVHMCTLLLYLIQKWASQVAQQQRFPLPMQEPQEKLVQSLGQGEPLEEEMATSSSILAWKIPWREKSGGYSLWGCKELDMIKHACTLTHAQKYSRYSG